MLLTSFNIGNKYISLSESYNNIDSPSASRGRHLAKANAPTIQPQCRTVKSAPHVQDEKMVLHPLSQRHKCPHGSRYLHWSWNSLLSYPPYYQSRCRSLVQLYFLSRHAHLPTTGCWQCQLIQQIQDYRRRKNERRENMQVITTTKKETKINRTVQAMEERETGTPTKPRSIAGFAVMTCRRSRCIASFVTNACIHLTIIACVSFY